MLAHFTLTLIRSYKRMVVTESNGAINFNDWMRDEKMEP